MKLSDIKPNPGNPRVIKDTRFASLLRSIQEFPKMLSLRPMVIDSEGYVLGGNMRLRALQELGYKDIPDDWVRRADDLTEEERQRFIIADNVGFGDWDWESLANDWDAGDLEAWGLEVQRFYEPVIDPSFNTSMIKEEDVYNAIEKMGNMPDNRKEGVLVCCPNCGADFNIQP